MRKVIILILLAVQALALRAVPGEETSETVADTVQLQEVEVVAIKGGGQSLPDAVSATVVGRREAEQLNIQALKGLSDVVPNFFVPDYGARITS